MKTIEIDDDIYDYLVKNTREIGESASPILRRLLGLKGEPGVFPVNSSTSDLADILSSPRLRLGTTVDKFLFILGKAYEDKPEKFESVLEIRGRERKYFARSKEEIEASGQSTQPKPIPGSPYWVMTNSPTRDKMRILREVLVMLGYSSESAKAASSSIEK